MKDSTSRNLRRGIPPLWTLVDEFYLAETICKRPGNAAKGTAWTCPAIGGTFIRAYMNPHFALYDCTNYDNGTGKVASI
jgi:hypothetical protein